MSIFEKLLEFLQPTKTQLKSMLIASVGTIGMVYFVGVKTANFNNTISDTNLTTKENTVMIKEIKNEIDNLKIQNKNDINNLYMNILDMNTRNSAFMNTKFNLLIDYGNSNKGLLKDMLKVQDEQQKLYEEQINKNKTYLNNQLGKSEDSVSIGVKQFNP